MGNPIKDIAKNSIIMQNLNRQKSQKSDKPRKIRGRRI